MENQQTEVEEVKEAPPQEASDTEHAQEEPSLDSLLAEYDEPKEETKQPAADTSQAPIPAEYQAFMDRMIQKETNQAVDEAAEMLQKAVGETNLSPRWFKGQLHLEASEDPRILKAFQNRDTNPQQWKEIVGGLGKKLGQDLRIDQQSTKSWDAVEASVNSSTSAPQKQEEGILDSKDLRKLSDQEFQAYKAKLMGRK